MYICNNRRPHRVPAAPPRTTAPPRICGPAAYRGPAPNSLASLSCLLAAGVLFCFLKNDAPFFEMSDLVKN